MVTSHQLEEQYFAAIVEGADLVAHGEADAAEQVYRRAVELGSKLDGGSGLRSAEAQLHLATCHAEQNEFVEALDELTAVVTNLRGVEGADPGLVGRAAMSRAAVFAALDRMDEAVTDAEEAIALLERAGDDYKGLVANARQLLVGIAASRSD